MIRSTLFAAATSPLLALAMMAPGWSATAVTNDTWPQYRGVNRDGISPEKLTFGADAPETMWKAKVGIGFSSLAISDGLVYASGNANDQDTLHCLDAKTGKSVWPFSYAQKLDPNLYEGGPNATPTIEKNAVSRECSEFCIHEFVHVAVFISSDWIVGDKVGMRGQGAYPVVMVSVMLYNVKPGVKQAAVLT